MLPPDNPFERGKQEAKLDPWLAAATRFSAPNESRTMTCCILKNERGDFSMFHDELKIGARRNGVLLALVSAMALGLMGCGEQAAPPLKQEVVALPRSRSLLRCSRRQRLGMLTHSTTLG